MPKPIFTKHGSLLIGEDSGFMKFYKYERPGENWKAFAGREFDIPMADGSVIKASGQWWDPLGIPEKYCADVCDVGLSTVEDLERCYVFTGGILTPRKLIEQWLRDNEPSNNYHKYNKRHDDYGKQAIVSPWN
jgi:hypothetical protein